MYLRMKGYADRVVKAVGGYYCASEDEGPVLDDENNLKLLRGHPYFEIREVPCRNLLVTDFVRILDREIDSRGTAGSMVESANTKRRGGIVGSLEARRKRVVPQQPIPPENLVLPADVPIDFFTPEYFNDLSVLDRAKYSVKPYVAFPPNVSAQWLIENPDQWAKMSDKDFDTMYGAKKMAYRFPTQRELDQYNRKGADAIQNDADDEERAQ
jgi:hypothetical protein